MRTLKYGNGVGKLAGQIPEMLGGCIVCSGWLILPVEIRRCLKLFKIIPHCLRLPPIRNTSENVHHSITITLKIVMYSFILYY